MVSEKCGHTLCQQCFVDVYKKEAGGGGLELKQKCFLAECEVQMLRRDYSQYESIERLVLNDNASRRKIKRIYNKTRQDFASQDEFNDYLEMIEDMIFALNDPETSKEEKKRIDAKIRADSRKLENEIANQNAKNDDQLVQFQHLVDLHQQMTDKMMRNLKQHFQGYDDVLDPEQLKLTEQLESFNLDHYGKNGITLDVEGDETMREGQANGTAGGVIGGVNLGYYRHPVHVKQDETMLTEIIEPRPAHQAQPTDDILAEVGGQRRVTHCLPLPPDTVSQIPLENLRAYQTKLVERIWQPCAITAKPEQVKCDVMFHSALQFF